MAGSFGLLNFRHILLCISTCMYCQKSRRFGGYVAVQLQNRAMLESLQVLPRDKGCSNQAIRLNSQQSSSIIPQPPQNSSTDSVMHLGLVSPQAADDDQQCKGREEIGGNAAMSHVHVPRAANPAPRQTMHTAIGPDKAGVFATDQIWEQGPVSAHGAASFHRAAVRSMDMDL